MERFLVDANIFITAKNFYYQFGFCRSFWDFCKEMHRKGRLFSIKSVKDEILKKDDELKNWVLNEIPDTFFEDQMKSTMSYAKLMNYSQGLDVLPIAKTEFALQENADAWLLAHALEFGYTIITQENFNPSAKRRIMIPNVANDHNIKTVTLFEFLQQYAGDNFSPKS